MTTRRTNSYARDLAREAMASPRLERMDSGQQQDYARDLARAGTSTPPRLARAGTSTPLLERMVSGEEQEQQQQHNRFISPTSMGALGVGIALSGALIYNKFLRAEEEREEVLDELMNEDVSEKDTNPILTSSGFMSNKRIAKEAIEKENGFIERSNIDINKINEFQQGARFIDQVYKNTKAYGAEYNIFKMNKERKNFVLQEDTFENHDVYSTGESLSHVFVDNEKKKSFIAMRGIEMGLDIKDQFEIIEMGLTAVLPQKVLDLIYNGKREDVKIFGKYFLQDLDHLVDVIEFSKDDFPEHEIILLGHSRAGAAVLEAGRAYNLKTFAYNPASNMRESNRDYTKHDPNNIHILMTERDIVPMFIRNLKDKIPENTYIMKNKGTDMIKNHAIHHFIESRNIHSITKTGVATEQVISPSPSKYSTEGIYTGYNERNDLFSDVPKTVFTTLNAMEQQPFNPVRLNVFDEIDTNQDNKITLKEYDNYYKNRGVPQAVIKSTFDSLDINDDKVLTRSEFKA